MEHATEISGQRLPGKLARFRRKDDREELERLQRLTGLAFDEVPESLLGNEEDAINAFREIAQRMERTGNAAFAPIR